MHDTFVLIVSKHKYLDTILLPCHVKKPDDREFFQVTEILRPQSSAVTSGLVSAPQKQIIEMAAHYDDRNLVEVYSKKKMLPKEFFEKLDRQIYTERIRPFIESMHVKMLDLAARNGIDMYIKNDNANLYPEDKVWHQEATPEVLFSFERNDEGLTYGQSLIVNGKRVSLLGKPFHILSNDPCRIIAEKTFFSINNIESKKLTPFFTKRKIQIPKKMEQSYFDTFVLNAVRHFPVEARGFTIEEVYQDPQFVLKLDRDLTNQSCFLLSYKYQRRTFEHGKKSKIAVEYSGVDGQYHYRKIGRNIQAEDAFCSELGQRGLLSDVHFFLKLSEDGSDGVEQNLEWLTQNASFLADRQVEILSQDNKHVTLDEPQIVSSSSFDHDWFDLKATVEIGDIKVPFIMLKNHILQGKREFVHNDRVFLIPAEWFARFSNVFIFGKQEGDSMRLEKHHMASAAEYLAGNNTSLPLQKLKSIMKLDLDPVELPGQLQASLRPYQIQGFRWLHALKSQNLGGCLADDMGLGKTLQTIALLLKTREELCLEPPAKDEVPSNVQLDLFPHEEPTRLPGGKPSLIIMPSSLVHNWFNEICKFAPGLKVYRHVGNDRATSSRQLSTYDVVLTTYGLARNDAELLASTSFHYVILDESQMVKNPLSKTYEAVCQLRARHRLVLTGTPIENDLEDLWSQMNFVNPGLLGNLRFFRENFCSEIENGNQLATARLKQLVGPFILRRHKQDVLTDLPEKQEQVVYCKMSDPQEKMYEEEKSKVRNLLLEFRRTGESPNKHTANILQSLLRLRQIANHPLLCHEQFSDVSGKFEEVTRGIDNIISEGHKVLVFSSFTRHLDLVGDYLQQNGIGYQLLTGETRDREKVVKQFQEDDTCNIFLISIKAGGTGLNLTQADYVFILDPWWNPAVEEQAVARAHRMGQQNKVFVYRFVTQNTIEEKIKQLQEQKSRLAEMFVDESALDLSEESLEYLLG